MDNEEKLRILEDIMDVDEGDLKPDMALEEVDEWDSLSALGLTVMLKKQHNIELTSDKLKSFVTVQDLCDIIP